MKKNTNMTVANELVVFNVSVHFLIVLTLVISLKFNTGTYSKLDLEEKRLFERGAYSREGAYSNVRKICS